jgi:hypothetical protein
MKREFQQQQSICRGTPQEINGAMYRAPYSTYRHTLPDMSSN